jgi:CubicO group peptidase (beta-lactamase class C family)
MTLFLLFVASWAQASFAATPDFSALEPKIDAFVEKFQPVPGTGVAVGIVKGRELVYFKGYGYRDREKKLPVTSKTTFAIGSVTKSFLATALAVLAEEEKVDFAAPVQSYLPGFKLEQEEATRSANLRDILSHQIGLPRHDFLWYFTPFSTNELFDRLGFLEMRKDPGYGFRSGLLQYNNLMFMTAGLVLEKQSGIAWPDYVSHRILQPLGMSQTNFTIEALALAAEPALAYLQGTALPYKSLEEVGAAGSMNSTPEDLAKWVGLHLNRGVDPDGKAIVSTNALLKLYEKHSEAPSKDGNVSLGYGLGMMLSEVAGRKVVWHGGNIDGFSAHVSFLPEEDLGLIILVNQNGAANFQFPVNVKQEGQPDTALLPYLIYDHLLGNNVSVGKPSANLESALAEFNFDFSSPATTAVTANEFLLASSAEETKYLGEFSERAYGDLSVVALAGGGIALNYYGAELPLRATGVENQFEVVAAGMVVNFEFTDRAVSAVKVPFEPAVNPIRFQISKIQ